MLTAIIAWINMFFMAWFCTAVTVMSAVMVIALALRGNWGVALYALFYVAIYGWGTFHLYKDAIKES